MCIGYIIHTYLFDQLCYGSWSNIIMTYDILLKKIGSEVKIVYLHNHWRQTSFTMQFSRKSTNKNMSSCLRVQQKFGYNSAQFDGCLIVLENHWTLTDNFYTSVTTSKDIHKLHTLLKSFVKRYIWDKTFIFLTNLIP